MRCVSAVVGVWAVLACTTALAAAPPSGSVYVAMGSSYAAGPGITTVVEGSPARCARSRDNYPHQLAQLRGYKLIDASCSGATTAHLLGNWNELAPQLDALTVDAALVTVTIGGNDLAYMGSLMAASGCAARGQQGSCAGVVTPTEADYQGVAARLRQILAEVRRRAPKARPVFVDYFTVLPEGATCTAAPMAAADATLLRDVAARLAALTAQVAQQGGAELLRLSQLTAAHHVCAAEPWLNGFVRPAGDSPWSPYHPTLQGMTGAARALDSLLER